MMLRIKNLQAGVNKTEILKGVDLEVKAGEIHVLMGPNGSGKSTLAQAIAGNPAYEVESGELKFENYDLRKLSPDKRARLGIFLAFQNPVEIPGVSVFNVLRRALAAAGPVKEISNFKFPISNSKKERKLSEFREELLGYASKLKLSPDHLSRSFNEGFSGGEKKRNEILQLLALSPKLAILDEIDSGLDVDGLKLVVLAISKFKKANPKASIIIITHYARILKYLKADFVHVMVGGRIIESGTGKLAKKVEEKGYRIWQTA